MNFDLSSYATTMARYNRWMNTNLYRVAAQLGEEKRKADCGLFFDSIHRTFNHLLLCDRLWLGRFIGAPVAVTSLGDELFADFEDLKKAREATDSDIEHWAGSLALSPLPDRLRFTSISGNIARDVDFAQAIIHFFNHQTHHRGQITAALSQYGVDFGGTDLLFMPDAARQPHSRARARA